MFVGIPAPSGSVDRVVVERPPPGAARGVLSVPAALVVALAAVLVIAAVAHLALRARRR
jgi:hypothetical protein